MNAYQAIATRMNRAEESFIKCVMEQFNKTQQEAEIILSVFKREKVVKIDARIGQFKLVHGAFWEAQVMDNALAIQ